MTVYVTDINIPLDLLQPMQASDAIEAKLGPADTGAGFGWRDLEIQSESEDDQQTVVSEAVAILMSYGYDVAVNPEDSFGRHRAYVRTRSVELPAPEPEAEQPRGLIPPGVEE